MTNTCACGNVTVTVKERPNFIYDCDCSLCRKSGAAWGYFKTADVQTSGSTIAYSRQDKPVPIVSIHSCSVCGSTTHFTITEAYKSEHPGIDQIGVNMRLFDLEQIEGIEVQYPNGSDWTGEGSFGFRKPAQILNPDNPW